MNPTLILGTILVLVLLYGIFNLLFVKSDVVMEVPLNSTYDIPGTDIIETENKKYSDYTHSFFIFLIDKPGSHPSTVTDLVVSGSKDRSGYLLVERINDDETSHFQVFINHDATKLIARALNESNNYNGVQEIGLKYQKHIFVTVVVKRNTIDLYLDGQLVNASVFDSENSASFYNTKITLSKTDSFKSGSENRGFLHSYRYTDRALTAEEILALYNSYVATYDRNSTTDFSARLAMTRDGEELTNLSKTFTF
tara:strand:- start:1093 stop:1851 length:759 start_codon:yes stop_codon:yes gene_type:complete